MKNSRAKAVRDKCLECSGNSPLEVTLCPVVTCPLWKWRVGTDTGKVYEKRVGNALRVHPDTLYLWKENGMDGTELKKYYALERLFEQK